MENESPIFLTFQSDSPPLPKNFYFTKLIWFNYKGIFASFNLKYLFAVGTTTGEIIIGGEDENDSISYVCVLIGHHASITYLLSSMMPDSFHSISSDGVLCTWSNLDGSCLNKKKIDALVNGGDHRLMYYFSNNNLIWIWTVGVGAYLVELKEGTVLHKIMFPGFQYFSYLTPFFSTFVNEDICILIGLSSIDVYRKKKYSSNNEYEFQIISSSEFNFFENKIIACENGILSFHKNTWKILLPFDLSELYKGVFDDMDSDDEINGINCCSTKSMCFSTLKGNYYVISIKKNSSSEISLFVENVFKTNIINPIHSIAFDKDNGIIFTPDSKKIIHMRNDNKKIIYSTKNTNETFSTTLKEQGIIFKTDGFKKVFEYDLINDKILNTFEFNQNITSLYFCNTQYSTLIIGHDDGTITFDEINKEKIKNKIGLLSPIIQFIELPLKTSLFHLIIGIGKNGSFCLIKNNKIIGTFNGNGFQITSIHCETDLDVFMIGYRNGEYIAYSFKGNIKPIQSITQPPKKSMLIYNNKNEKINVVSILPIKNLNFSYFYQNINITELQSKILQENKKDDLIHAAEHFYSVIKGLNESQSLAFSGYDNSLTFFYPPYRVNIKNIFKASSNIGALHLIGTQILSDILGYNSILKEIDDSSIVINFLPIIIKLLFESNKLTQIRCSKICLEFMFLISFQKCQEYVSPYLYHTSIESISKPEKLLLAILTSKFPNAIPSTFLNDLYKFLMEMIFDLSQVGILSLCILIEGIHTWRNYAVQEKQLYISIIIGVIKQEKNEFLENKLSAIICSDLNLFLSIIPNMVDMILQDEKNKNEKLSQIFDLYTEVARNNSKLVGGMVSYELAKLLTPYSMISDIITFYLKKHSTLFEFVEQKSDIIAIGTPNGTVHVFQNNKLLFSESIFEGPIVYISISPTNNYMSAISIEDSMCKILKLTTKLFQKSHVILSTEIIPPLPNTQYFVDWSISCSPHSPFISLKSIKN